MDVRLLKTSRLGRIAERKKIIRFFVILFVIQ